MNIISLTLKTPWDIHVYIITKIKVHLREYCDMWLQIFFNKEFKPTTWTLTPVIKSSAYSNVIVMKKKNTSNEEVRYLGKHKCKYRVGLRGRLNDQVMSVKKQRIRNICQASTPPYYTRSIYPTATYLSVPLNCLISLDSFLYSWCRSSVVRGWKCSAGLSYNTSVRLKMIIYTVHEHFY